MAMAARMAMPIDAQVLTLAQWLSPGFPIGAFAYSHGLEAAAQSGWVRDAEGLENWLVDILDCGAGRADALFLAAAYRADDAAALATLDATARAYAASAERLLESDAQGAAFCKQLNSSWDMGLDGLLYPIALGAAAAQEALPLALSASMYLQAFAANLVAAAQRLLPVGQTEAQAIIKRQTVLCRQIAAETNHGELTELSSTAYLADISAMQHETQYSRIFRT